MVTNMATSNTGLVVKFALFSRLLLLAIQVVFNVLLVDHDAGAFTSAKEEDRFTKWDQFVQKILSGLTRWDAQYFLHIAEHSYSYENTLAFFPLFPMSVEILAKLLYYFAAPAVSFYSCVTISGVAINIIYFVCSAYFLHKLSAMVLKNEENALLAAILFCINPASIFFSAVYSEALFSLLAFASMYFIEKNKIVPATILVSLCCVTRSNGVILCGYLIYRTLKQISNIVKYKITDSFSQIVQTCIPELGRLGLQLFISILPFVLFQVYACMVYCIPYLMTLSTNIPKILEEHAVAKNYVMPSESSPPWCYSTVPFPYAYVQKHYWDVGFLRYYEWKQIPNFLLATPMCVLIAWFCRIWFERVSYPFPTLDRLFRVFEGELMTPYILHAIGQTTLCVLCIHVQVTTRISCSSSPIVYWAAASILSQGWQDYWRWIKKEHREETPTCYRMSVFIFRTLSQGRDDQKLILGYFLVYILIGTLMFTNYYPWT